MIVLHRLTNPDHPLYLNPDLIQTIEANPDTVITLENALQVRRRTRRPEQIVDLIRELEGSVIARRVRRAGIGRSSFTPFGAEPDRSAAN